jgi:hypothetical protein
MGPIFFKMMLTKGPYDYMVENYNNLTNAENGVLKEDHIYEGKDGIIYMEKYRYLEVDKAKDAKTAPPTSNTTDRRVIKYDPVAGLAAINKKKKERREKR